MAKVLEGTDACTEELSAAGPVPCVCLSGFALTLWRGEMNDVAVRLEHVDLLNCLNWLHVHLLQGRLQLLVVGARALVDLLDLSSRGALASVNSVSDLALSNLRVRSSIEGKSAGGIRIHGKAAAWSCSGWGRCRVNVSLTLRECQPRPLVCRAPESGGGSRDCVPAAGGPRHREHTNAHCILHAG